MRHAFTMALVGLAVSTSAMAADLPSRGVPTPYIPAPPVFTWTGFYIGAFGGGVVAGDFRGTALAPLPPLSASATAGGFTAGGTVGYNYQFSPGNGFVVGVEGDIGYSDISNRLNASFPGLGSATVRASTDDYFATIRGRLGYAFGPALFYVTGGGAFTTVRFSAGVNAPGLFVGSVNTSRGASGYTVGGGVEYAITPSISAKVEYLYTEFDRNTYSLPGVAGLAGFTPQIRAGLDDVHQLKVGVNYKFNFFQ